MAGYKVDSAVNYFVPYMTVTQGAVDKGYNQISQIYNKGVQNYIDKLKQSYGDYDNYMQQSTNNAIKGLQGQYQSVYDTNAVNQAIQSQQAQNSLQRMGLAKSGLNATQQTGFQIARYNADTATTQQQTRDADNLRAILQQYRANASQQRAEAEANAWLQASQQNAQAYSNLYGQGMSMAGNMASDTANSNTQRNANVWQNNEAIKAAELDRQFKAKEAEKDRKFQETQNNYAQQLSQANSKLANSNKYQELISYITSSKDADAIDKKLLEARNNGVIDYATWASLSSKYGGAVSSGTTSKALNVKDIYNGTAVRNPNGVR